MQELKARNNHTIEGNLTSEQIAKLVQLAEDGETLNFKIDGFAIEIKIGRWQKGDLDRLYINKSHGSKAGRNLFGSHSAACWINPVDGSIHAPSNYAQMSEVGTLYILAELFALEIYRAGGLKAVAE